MSAWSAASTLHGCVPCKLASSTAHSQCCGDKSTPTSGNFAPAGPLRITTEFGVLNVLPGQIAVVQRGMRFSVALPGGPARGYVLEVFGGHFALPDLGLIGTSSAAQLIRRSTAIDW